MVMAHSMVHSPVNLVPTPFKIESAASTLVASIWDRLVTVLGTSWEVQVVVVWEVFMVVVVVVVVGIGSVVVVVPVEKEDCD